LLPTVLFIIAAYTVYALVVGWCRWQRSRFLDRRGKTRPRWLTVAGGAVILGVLLWIIFWLAPAASDHNLRLAGILGVSEGRAWLAEKDIFQKFSLHLDQEPTNGQPVYAFLHPESPPSLLPPAKPPVGIKHRKPTGKSSSVQKPPKRQLKPRLTKKDRSRNKKTSKPPARKSSRSEDITG
jgi:hypothetical protein